nr:glycosyltransferase [uncultured Schaedlerella sp.]
MRIVLFYTEVESFNFFSNVLSQELQKRGHEIFILDLLNPPAENPHSYVRFSQFASAKVDAAVSFDGLGIKDDLLIGIWNAYHTVVVDIFMDPPLRFHTAMEKHPQNYLMFCCDWDHVEYVKKYFGQSVPCVGFMPHVGVMPDQNIPVIPYAQKKYDVLFSGTYYSPENRLSQVEEMIEKGTAVYDFYQILFECLVEDSRLTIEQGAFRTIERMGLPVDQDMLKSLMRCAEPVDWAIRMYQRGRVVEVLAESGVELYLLGRGWENHCSAKYPNVHRIDDRIPYADTLAYMADARLNLNVFPWFKAGTHDRIFNALLQHSLPLTDSSRWVDENFTNGEDIALYDLEHLEKLPEIVGELLRDTERAERMIQKGYEKTAKNLTWSNCADWILTAIEQLLRTGGPV